MPFKKPLVTPLVNINGDHHVKLIEDLIDLRAMLFKVMGQMRSMGPHGRNFQTMKEPKKALADAREAWDERVQTMLDLYAELGAMAEAINSQSFQTNVRPTVQ